MKRIFILLGIIFLTFLLLIFYPRSARIKTMNLSDRDRLILDVTNFDGTILMLENMKRCDFEIRAKTYFNGKPTDDKLLYTNVFSGKQGLIGIGFDKFNNYEEEYLYISDIDENYKSNVYVDMSKIISTLDTSRTYYTKPINEKVSINKMYKIKYISYGNLLKESIYYDKQFQSIYDNVVLIYIIFKEEYCQLKRN